MNRLPHMNQLPPRMLNNAMERALREILGLRLPWNIGGMPMGAINYGEFMAKLRNNEDLYDRVMDKFFKIIGNIPANVQNIPIPPPGALQNVPGQLAQAGAPMLNDGLAQRMQGYLAWLTPDLIVDIIRAPWDYPKMAAAAAAAVLSGYYAYRSAESHKKYFPEDQAKALMTIIDKLNATLPEDIKKAQSVKPEYIKRYEQIQAAKSRERDGKMREYLKKYEPEKYGYLVRWEEIASNPYKLKDTLKRFGAQISKVMDIDATTKQIIENYRQNPTIGNIAKALGIDIGLPGETVSGPEANLAKEAMESMESKESKPDSSSWLDWIPGMGSEPQKKVSEQAEEKIEEVVKETGGSAKPIPFSILAEYDAEKKNLLKDDDETDQLKKSVYEDYEAIVKECNGDTKAVLKIETEKPELLDKLINSLKSLESHVNSVSVAKGGVANEKVLVDDGPPPSKAELEGGKTRKSKNPWVDHVKAYAKKHDMSYFEALGPAKASYKSGGMHPGIKQI